MAGAEWLGTALHGVAGLGAARRGSRGTARHAAAGRGLAWQEWQGSVRRGKARRGEVWQVDDEGPERRLGAFVIPPFWGQLTYRCASLVLE